jgi:hypothetical protein|tara:strand:+ start:2533 stop:3459 length:927 start_codon:yes stop_codon:yes gene_type:complete
MNVRILQLVETIIGKGSKKTDANYAFYCPFCNHRKQKLEINLETTEQGENFWHCWTCDSKGKTLISFFRRLKVGQNKFEKLNKLLGNTFTTKKVTTYIDQELPKEYEPLWIQKDHPEWLNAISYLIRDRKLTREDILKYRIGYCANGLYARKIIIPSYDENGELNFFTGRSYYDEDYKHKNPKWSKDVVGFGLFVNWKLPIVLCEGPMDAITIKRNAIPLFGKIVLDKIKLQIVEQKVKQVYIALDSDALKKALEMVEYFMNHGIQVHLVNMDDKDPNEMGFENITKLIKNTPPINFAGLMELKLFAL